MPGDEVTSAPSQSAPTTAQPSAGAGPGPSSGGLSDSLSSNLSDSLVKPAPPPAPPPADDDPSHPSAQGGTRNPVKAAAAFKMPTFDAEAFNPQTKKKGMWVDAAPDKDDASAIRKDKDGNAADRRQVKGAKEPSERGQALNAEALKGGNLSEHEAEALPAAVAKQINPLSDVPRNILKHTFGSTWSKAKHALVGKGAGPEMVMTKLWEFRQFHHEKILNDTKATLDAEEKGQLTEWASAGSTTLTSDIDINLKGSNTEKAVKVFNEKFKADGFPFESGVVYDVNVYALDFMHANTFKDGGVNEGLTRISGKEGQRKDQKEGGFSSTLKGMEDKEKDASNQEEWSQVKMRIYMSAPEWAAYKKNTDPNGEASDKWARIEARYASYVQTLREEMGQKVTPEVEAAEAQEKSGADQLKAAAANAVKGTTALQGGSDEGAAENALMGAQNRTYEAKLVQIKKLRIELNSSIDRFNAGIDKLPAQAFLTLQNRIDDMLLELRELMSEAALYSNEAYITDGAVNHAVVGIQSGVGISQTKSEGFAAANENVADVLKEMARHGDTAGEAVYKASKYMWRLGDAARNMGATKLAYVSEFYDVGFKVANEIKGGGGSGGKSKEAQAFDIAQKHLGVSRDDKAGVSALMQITRTLGVSLANWYKKQESSRQERGSAISNKNTRAAPPSDAPSAS